MQEKSAVAKMESVFDRHANDFLSFTANLGGRTEKVYLLQEMMYDDHDLVDYTKLARRLRKLPAILTYFGALKSNAEFAVADEKEAFDLWYAQKSTAVKEQNTKDLLIQAGPASLKKPLTMEEVRYTVMLNHEVEWNQKKSVIRAAEERLVLLSRLMEGLKAAIDLTRSEATLVGTLLSQGLERGGDGMAPGKKGGFRDFDN